jgi:ABC-type transporter Mla subunit MlaD
MAVTPSNYFKLGIFVVLAIAAAVAMALIVGAQALNTDTVRYHTYFDESVAGLDVGAPVKFRGVKIGSVAAIDIAPDHRHVDVATKLEVERSSELGLGGPQKTRVPPDLRAQIGTQGITGVKYVSLDFLDPTTNPPPQLSFQVPETYIPAATSTLKNLEDALTKASDRIPELADSVAAVAGRVDRLLGKLEQDDAAGKTNEVLARADAVLASLGKTVAQLERSGVPARAAQTLDDVRAAVTKLDAILDRVGGEDGLLASVRRASEAIGGFGRGAGASTRELDQTLRDVREAAESIRSLSESLERDPDMLLKGRAKAKGQGR